MVEEREEERESRREAQLQRAGDFFTGVIVGVLIVVIILLLTACNPEQNAYNVNPDGHCEGHVGVQQLHRGHHYKCKGNPPTWTRID